MITGRLYRLWLRGRFLLFQRHRHRRLVLERLAGLPLLVLPDVFNPTLFLTTPFFASTLDANLVPPGSRVLEVGTGSGALALVAARLGALVTAIDINPEAVRCARLNAELNRFEDRVEAIQGDLFSPVRGRRFDVVLTNPPFYCGTPRDLWDTAWRSEDFFVRFTAQLGAHLAPSGHALVLLSTAAPTQAFFDGCRDSGLATEPLRQRAMPSETLTLYRIRRAS
ncbi:MAG: methyltransferase [Acidobacteriota bacterium]